MTTTKATWARTRRAIDRGKLTGNGESSVHRVFVVVVGWDVVLSSVELVPFVLSCGCVDVLVDVLVDMPVVLVVVVAVVVVVVVVLVV